MDMKYQYNESYNAYYTLHPKKGIGWLVEALCPEYALAKIVNAESNKNKIFCVVEV